MNKASNSEVFDYRALRLMIGIIALILPVLVCLRSSTPLSSISASYYTESRDYFVGLLFFVAAFLFAYNGHTTTEMWVSSIACFAAIVVATFPTACDSCASNPTGVIHYFGAATLFSILAYFCLFAFRVNTKGQTGKKKRRDTVYVICGWIIVACLLGALVTKLTMPDQMMVTTRVTLYIEWVALWAFGFAWLVAGKTFSWFADEDEKLKLEAFIQSRSVKKARRIHARKALN